jgi:hypothetical protein
MLRNYTTLGFALLLLSSCATAPPTILLHGKYRVTPTNQVDEVEATEQRSTLLIALARTSTSGDTFAGTDRRDPKTSVATGALESYPAIAALRSSFPTDQFMRGLGITRAPDSERTSEEQHNVTVGAYIYAASKESDNDFHLIVGDKGCAVGGCFINVEVSGLPQQQGNPNFQTLSAVRTKFLTYLNQHQPSRGYEKFAPPIAVTLTGSIFFDVDHPAGTVGPVGLKPSSAWEIHPLTDIVFEP